MALIGASGKELLSSKTFREPRAKGATVRSLKSLLGGEVIVEDHTVGNGRLVAAPAGKGPRPQR